MEPEAAEEDRPVRLGNAGSPVTELWAWVVTDKHGQEAMCVSPWSKGASLMSPDRESIDNKGIEHFCRQTYEPHGFTVELRRFVWERG